MTGEGDVTKVNFITMLNWLSLEMDLAREEEKRNKKLLNEYRRR